MVKAIKNELNSIKTSFQQAPSNLQNAFTQGSQMIQNAFSFGPAKRTRRTHISYKKARTTTINGTKRVLYRKITLPGAGRRCLPSATYTPFKKMNGVQLYLRTTKKRRTKRHPHNFGYYYDPYTSYPMSFGYYYY